MCQKQKGCLPDLAICVLLMLLLADGRYMRNKCNFFFMANGLDDDKAKKAIFLSSCGTETYALLKSIATTENITDASFTFDKAITLLRKHFCPHANIIIQRFQFYRRDQQEEESMPEYLAALRKLCQHCNFKDLDEMLKGC